jgi:hypothetical protein
MSSHYARRRRTRSPRRTRRKSLRRGGSPSCGQGKIRRSSYLKKSSTQKRRVRVKSSCVPDKGKPGKTPKAKRVLPKLTPGKLGKYGYHHIKRLPANERRGALTRAVKAEGYAPIIRRLNVIRTYNKNDPIFTIYDSDLKWMQRNLKPIYSATAQKVLRRRSSF